MPDEPHQYRSCDVCGRTILRGEQVKTYVTPQGDEVIVCPLCRGRAEAAGWLPEELAEARVPPAGSRRRPQLALRSRLGKVAERARSASSSHRAAAEPEAPPAPQPSEPQRSRKPADGARPQPKPKRRRSGSPQSVTRRAIERFNSSDEARTVAGLIRSLGEPSVAVVPKGDHAVVTVAWELSWYQWEVNGDYGVRELAKGSEVSELPEEARTWNAAADSDGRLSLVK